MSLHPLVPPLLGWAGKAQFLFLGSMLSLGGEGRVSACSRRPSPADSVGTLGL